MDLACRKYPIPNARAACAQLVISSKAETQWLERAQLLDHRLRRFTVRSACAGKMVMATVTAATRAFAALPKFPRRAHHAPLP